MGDQVTELIENNENDLMKLIRFHTEEILHQFNYDYSLKSDYSVRNEIVMYTYGVITKKYLNKSTFEKNKDNIVRRIVQTYIIHRNF